MHKLWGQFRFLPWVFCHSNTTSMTNEPALCYHWSNGNYYCNLLNF